MASFQDVKLTKGVWINISDAVGEAADVDLQIQNNSENRIRVETDSSQPTNNDVGLIVAPFNVATAITGATEDVWGFSKDVNAIVGVQVAT